MQDSRLLQNLKTVQDDRIVNIDLVRNICFPHQHLPLVIRAKPRESYTHNVTSESINLSSLPRLFGHRGKCAYSIHTDLPQKQARKTGVWWVLRHPGVCVFWGTWGPGFSRSSSQPATRVNFNTRDAWKEKMKAPRDLLLMNGASARRLTWITIGSLSNNNNDGYENVT